MGRKQKPKIVRYSIEDIKKMKGTTNWEKVESMTDVALEEIVKNDPSALNHENRK